MPKTTQVRAIPTLTVWNDAVDQVNYAKGTDIQVVKGGGKNYGTGGTYAPNQGAQPLFHYLNAKGKLGDHYDINDVTEVAKVVKAKTPVAPVKVTQKGFTTAQLAKIQALVTAGLL